MILPLEKFIEKDTWKTMKPLGEFVSSWSIYYSSVEESEGYVKLATSSVNLLFDYYVIKLLALWEIKTVR